MDGFSHPSNDAVAGSAARAEPSASSRWRAARRRNVFLLAVVTVFVMGFAPRTRAQNVSITDYNTPVSRASSLLADVRYGYERLDETTLANDGRVGLRYDLFYESIPFAYSVDALGEWSRTWVDNDFDTAYAVDATARAKAYAWRDRDLFASITSDESYQRGDDRPATTVTLAMGWGRFINATALHKAVRIDTYFVDEGVTNARMHRDAMLRLAEIIESRPAYEQRHGSETYRKYWFGAIEQAAVDSGSLVGEGVGAAGIFRVEEVLFRENIGDRFYGYDAALGVRYDLTGAAGSGSQTPTRVDLTARYARPIRWSTQLDGRLTVNTPLNADLGRAYDFDASLGYIYELTNRVDLRVDYVFAARRPTRAGDFLASHAILPSFLLYLEDELRLVATIRVVKPTLDPWRQELALTLNYKAF